MTKSLSDCNRFGARVVVRLYEYESSQLHPIQFETDPALNILALSFIATPLLVHIIISGILTCIDPVLFMDL